MTYTLCILLARLELIGCLCIYLTQQYIVCPLTGIKINTQNLTALVNSRKFPKPWPKV